VRCNSICHINNIIIN